MLEEGAASTMALEVTHRQEGKASKASKGSTKGCTKAHIDRLICTSATPTAHFSVGVDGLRLSAVRFVSVSPQLSEFVTKTFPVAVFDN